ncbi:MAG: hypothetical protein NZ989_07435 [Bacteroidia bacterium]|nr:hypothetical protein [Bacteroidia bacterium]MDW8058081.1 hypothetical protein [Bacteroidia bacterium]
MEIELLWPLVQELIHSSDISEEDWVFLTQNAETLGCSEATLRAMVEARLAREASALLPKVQALSNLVESLGAEAGRKTAFLLEVAEYLSLPVELVQTLVQVPRAPVLRYLSRLLKVIEVLGGDESLLQWVEERAQALQMDAQVVRYLRQLTEAAQKKTSALQSYWELLRALEKRGMPAIEVSYLSDLAREARISEAISQGLQDFLRMRQRGQSALESLAHLVRYLSQKGVLSEEEKPFLAALAQQEGLPHTILEGLMELEKALRQISPGAFGAEYLQPLLRALISANALDESAYRLLTQRGNELGLTRTQIEAIAELEKQILEQKVKFPQSIQPLIRVFVENARIPDDRLLYIVKKAQEIGGSEKIVRSLVQIEIAAQKKALQERITPPSTPSTPAVPSSESPSGAQEIATALPSEPLPTVQTPPPLPAQSETPSASSSAPSSQEKKTTSLIDSGVSAPTKIATYPKGGNFPSIPFDFSSIKIFSLRNEKDIIRKADILSKDGRVNWYALIEYGSTEYILIAKGKPEHRFEEVLGWAVSPTGEVIAIKHRFQGSYRVYLNGEEGRPLDDISSMILSPNHKHVAYIARKGEDIFVFLDNVGMGPFQQVTNLTFRPNEQNDLFFVYQVDKNRWQIRDYLGNAYGEPAAVIDLLTFSPDGKRMVYTVLKNRKFHLREGDQMGEPFDLISDIAFTPDSAHLVYLVRKGMQIGITWDGSPLHWAEGISGVTLSPNSRFVCYISREKEQSFLHIHNKPFGPYDKVERPFITQTQAAVIYPVVKGGKHHVFANGMPEAGPFDALVKFSGQGDSYAAVVRKGGEGQAVLRDGKLGKLYSVADQLVWGAGGRSLAYVARQKGGWAGVVWNETESDHYDFVQHHTFDPEGKALLFFARRRDGWYAVLNDTPIPDSLCREILTPPIYDRKLQAFLYLYRQGRDVFEGRITLR